MTECKAAEFHLGNQVLPASNVKIKTTSLAVALWDTSTLLRVAEYEGEVRFEGCGFSATLRKGARQAIASYVGEFRDIAERYGTWKPAPVVEVEEAEEAEATPPSDNSPADNAPSEPPPSPEEPASAGAGD